MLYVNTIEFAGRKAVMNSYSVGYVDRNEGGLGDDMRRQAAEFAARFPNATVRTELLTEAETIKLCAQHKGPEWHLRSASWEIGQASKGEA